MNDNTNKENLFMKISKLLDDRFCIYTLNETLIYQFNNEDYTITLLKRINVNLDSLKEIDEMITNPEKLKNGFNILSAHETKKNYYINFLKICGPSNNGKSTTLTTYGFGTIDDTSTDPYSIYGMQTKLNELENDANNALSELESAKTDFGTINMPEYVGNCKLTSLGELSKEQLAEIKQVIRTMTENGVQSNFDRCFESSLNITEDNYIGGIYSFERDGVTYYTTYYDLADATINSEFMNDIDNQPKLNYYHANYVKENISTTDKAVLDTDSKGRFKSVRFASDGAQYTLTVEQITDDVAYQDAMNKYAYESAEYDKMIQDINAKTSLIHQQDQQLELKLKQLETEQNALSNEIDAVSKVAKDNVEKSFKTFGS